TRGGAASTGPRGAPRSWRGGTGPDHPYGEQRHAHADRRVGHVEGGPVVVAPVEVEEVHHGAEPSTVDQVARGAAEDESERDPGRPAAAREQPDADGGQYSEGNQREGSYDPAPGRRRGGKHAECEARIHDQREREDAVHHADGRAWHELPERDGLGE